MAVNALIFDDDPYFVGFLASILEDLGLSVGFFYNGYDALEHIRRESPNLVLLDVMIPGGDGLSLCKELKADPVLARIKVAIISGKAFTEDKARADWAKADLYVVKPFDVQEFSAQILQLSRGFKRIVAAPGKVDAPVALPAAAELVAGPAPKVPAAPAPPPIPAPSSPIAAPAFPKSPRDAWKIRFWGKGLDSDCISMTDRNRLIVLDAGSGMEALSREEVDLSIDEVWLLLSHFHQNHVAALAHAENWIRAGLKVHVVGPADSEALLQRLMERVLPHPAIAVHSLPEGRFDGIPGLQVDMMHTMHPGPCFAYRLETPGRCVVFAPDGEIPPPQQRSVADNTEKLATFALNADLLVHDARYSDKDYPQFAGQGHSSPQAALEVALRAGARRLVLFHLDGRYPAEERDAILAEVRSRGGPESILTGCDMARYGLQIDLPAP